MHGKLENIGRGKDSVDERREMYKTLKKNADSLEGLMPDVRKHIRLTGYLQEQLDRMEKFYWAIGEMGLRDRVLDQRMNQCRGYMEKLRGLNMSIPMAREWYGLKEEEICTSFAETSNVLSDWFEENNVKFITLMQNRFLGYNVEL